MAESIDLLLQAIGPDAPPGSVGAIERTITSVLAIVLPEDEKPRYGAPESLHSVAVPKGAPLHARHWRW